jgi:hypothetical protein
MASAERGSEKVLQQLFGGTAVDGKQLASAVAQASSSGLKLERWWWKGQPHPDLIRAVVTIPPAEVGPVIAQLVSFHSELNQVSLEAFPRGLPRVDAVGLNITINRNNR